MKMRAAVAGRLGPPDVLTVREVPRPEVREGWTLVEVKGFGLNQSDLMTRQGLWPDVRFPRVLGTECVGLVAASSDPALSAGTVVAAAMGGMGREFDGGYAESALVPNELLIPVSTSLDWEVLAALPQTYLTAYGSLEAMSICGRDGTLLVRGAASPVGMAALSLAKRYGLSTIATTRWPDKAEALHAGGADHVVVGGECDIAAQVRQIRPDGPEYALDLVGANTVLDSLHLVSDGGTVCISGPTSGVWTIPSFEPVAIIPSGTKLTAFHGDDLKGAAAARALQQIVDGVACGEYRANVDRVFRLDEIVEAHRYMEEDQGTGKVVVLTRL